MTVMNIVQSECNPVVFSKSSVYLSLLRILPAQDIKAARLGLENESKSSVCED